jgi:DNA-binding transcriptional regulator/RsmH inhibitor MraZ
VQVEFKISLKNPGMLDRGEIERQSPELGKLLGEPVMVTASPDRRAVMIYSLQQWEHLVPRLWQLPKDNELARRFMQIFFGYAYRLEAGEPIYLSEPLARYARLDKDTVQVQFDAGRQCLSIEAEQAA